MNDLFIKFIEKLASIDNTALFAASIFPYAILLFYLYKIKSVNNLVKTGYTLTVLFVFNRGMRTINEAVIKERKTIVVCHPKVLIENKVGAININ